MNTQNTDTIDISETDAYISYLEEHVLGLERTRDSLWSDNVRLRRSLAAYKANTTRRNNRTTTTDRTAG
jgi:hypothetical protein